MRYPVLIVVLLLTLVIAGCGDDDPTGPYQGRTIRVPAQFATIQEAVDAAFPGDLVLVAAGTYSDSVYVEHFPGVPMVVCVNLKPGVEIRGETDKAGDVVLMGNSDNPVVTSIDVGAQATLSNLTIKGGKSGILGSRSVVNIVNCAIVDNHNETQFGSGAGLYFDFSTVSLTNCIVSGNRAASGGGATFANESRVILTNCLFTGNTALSSPNQPGTGGALMLGNNTRATATNVMFSSNHADSLGGAIEIYQSNIDFVNCNISNNDTGGLGGAVYVNYGGQVVITNGLVENNHSDRTGGGFYFRSPGSLTATTTRIQGNTAPEGPDGFIRGPYEPAVVTLRCCDFNLNNWVGTVIVENDGCE